MTTIYFGGKCFKEFESELYMKISAKSEFTDWRLFGQAAMKQLIADKFTIIDENYREKAFTESSDEDSVFMKSIVLNMKDAVKIDFEEVLESYTMEQEDPFEHIMILCTANDYYMLYWNTTA